jgi:hypothetical protein
MTEQTKVQQVHLLIVTGQAQANLIPILQLKPDIIALAISDSMQKKADQFIKIVKSLTDYKEDSIIFFKHVPDAGIERIIDKAMEIEDQLNTKFPNSKISYHATGGNKLMTLGFYSVFSDKNNQIIYCDTSHGEIEHIYPEKQSAIPIQSVLNIKGALLSMEQTYRKSADEEWQKNANSRKELTKWLGHNAQELDQQGFLGCLNKFVQEATKQTSRDKENVLTYPEQYFRQVPRRIWVTALKKLTEHKIFQWDKNKPNCLYFDSIQGAEYISGQWLEEYTWHIIKDLNPFDVLANVEFAESCALKSDIRNEMDCIVAHHNQLLFIECKTINFQKQIGKDTDILYKLESLGHRAAGLYGYKWLVSARKLDDPALKRAKEYKIEVIYGADLKNLKDKVIEWMAKV